MDDKCVHFCSMKDLPVDYVVAKELSTGEVPAGETVLVKCANNKHFVHHGQGDGEPNLIFGPLQMCRWLKGEKVGTA